MNPASKDIADILAADSSLGLTYATNLGIAREPNSPDNYVTIFDLQGDGPQLNFRKSTSNLYNSAVSIRIRNTSYLNAYELAFNILQVLHAKGNEVWNGTLYLIIKAISDPQLLTWDENNRAIMIVNFEIKRKVSGGIGEMIIEKTFKIG